MSHHPPFPEGFILPDDLADLEPWRNCGQCPALVEQRFRTDVKNRLGPGKVVLGEGPCPADLMIVGHIPGPEEDIQGRVQVGLAGRMLDTVLEIAEIDRASVYLTNLISCATPDNRAPTRAEIVNCWPRFAAEVYLVDPLVIVAAGSVATEYILGPGVSVTNNQGELFTVLFQGRETVIPRCVMPMLQPAHLNKQPGIHEWGPVHRTVNHLRTALDSIRRVRAEQQRALQENHVCPSTR
jgi:uracil-DNA glycosylase